jgi:hypothetical protein
VSGTIPNLSDQVDKGVFDAFQMPYSALQRDHEGVIAKASKAGAGIIIRLGAPPPPGPSVRCVDNAPIIQAMPSETRDPEDER